MNTEHQLNSKLAWSVFQKSMKLKQKWYNGGGAMTTAKNDVLIFLLGWIDFSSRRNKNLVRRRGMSKFLAGRGDSPHHTSEENPVYIYHIKLYILYILLYKT